MSGTLFEKVSRTEPETMSALALAEIVRHKRWHLEHHTAVPKHMYSRGWDCPFSVISIVVTGGSL